MLHRPILTGALMIAGTLAIVFGATHAHSAPTGSPTFGQTLVCDTKRQLEDIIEISKTGDLDALTMKMHDYAVARNDKGDSLCAVGYVTADSFKVIDSVDEGDITTNTGKKIHAWAVHIVNDKLDYWAIYAEPIAPPV